MPGESLLQSLQRLITFAQRLDALAKKMDELQALVFARLDRLENQVVEMRERLARLEMARDADRAQMQADLARFMAEMERAVLRLTRQPDPPQLSGGDKEGA
jgi:hypothetical protein